MGNKKPTKHVTSTTSAAANPAASSKTHIPNQSSILRSSFAPSSFGVPLFASTIQGFDSQRLRIHDTTSGRLRCEHSVTPQTVITCLDWGYFGESRANQQQQVERKKRKRSSQLNGVTSAKNIVLAYGTNLSEIQIYSPTESKVLGVLKDGHSGGIRDFKFQDEGRERRVYSVGGDGKMVQWDLNNQTVMMTMTIPNSPASAVRPVGSKVICASHFVYLMDPKSEISPTLYKTSTNNVHTVLGSYLSPNDCLRFLTVAEIDHFINVFDKEFPTLIGSLRTENEILAADLWSSDHSPMDDSQELTVRMMQPRQVLSVLNKDGVLELFPEPFDFAITSSGKSAESVKARVKQRTRKSAAQIKVVRPDSSVACVPLINASFQGSNVVLAWAEGGVNVIFDTVQWRDEETGKLLLNDMVEIVKAKSGSGLGAVIINGVKDLGKNQVDDSHTVVANGLDAGDVSMDETEPEVIDISSAEEESAFEEDEPLPKPSARGKDVEDEHGYVEEEREKDIAHIGDESMQDVDTQEKLQEEAEPPSFGDLMRANAPDPISVPNTLTDGNPQSLVPTTSTSLQALPSGMSLGTVLTQSLRTNDTNLLESCLHTKDLSTVRSTIERLDSSSATNLLQRLAERLHNRPGRAGSLMVWIQWTLVAHGGYLAGQPEVMRKLKSLHRVVKERAGSLQSLLSLKGKLDMLEAQMNLRRSILERRRGVNVEDEDDEEAVIYVEGQEDEDSEEEDDSGDSEGPDATNVTAPRPKALRDTDVSEEEADEDQDQDHNIRPTTNGVTTDVEEGSNSDEDGMIDEEASESDNDSEEELDDDDVNHESADTESSDGEASPPPKRPAKGRRSNGVGSRGL